MAIKSESKKAVRLPDLSFRAIVKSVFYVFISYMVYAVVHELGHAIFFWVFDLDFYIIFRGRPMIGLNEPYLFENEILWISLGGTILTQIVGLFILFVLKPKHGVFQLLTLGMLMEGLAHVLNALIGSEAEDFIMLRNYTDYFPLVAIITTVYCVGLFVFIATNKKIKWC